MVEPTPLITDAERKLLTLLRGVGYGKVTVTVQRGKITVIERAETIKPDDL